MIPLVAALALLTSAQTASSPAWSLAPGAGLVWAGVPYRPLGVRVPGDPGAIAAVRGEGAGDLLVDLPAAGDWKPALEALKGSRYLLALASTMPMADGYTVLPQSYRIEGVTASAPLSVPLPGARSAFVAVALRRDATLVWSGTVPVVDGVATFTPKTLKGSEHVVLVYPLGPSLRTPDLWEGLDAHRDALVAHLRDLAKSDPDTARSGLRGIVDPFGTAPSLAASGLDVVPISPLFRAEFASRLEDSYRNLLALQKAWALSGGDFDSFEDVARLVPLWREARGIGYVLDPQTGRTYRVEQKRSALWRDLANAVAASREKRLPRLLEAIRRETNVPIVQSWRGWSPVTESPAYGFDGLGFEAAASGVARTVEAASRPLSSLERSRPGGLLVATDLDLGTTPTPGAIETALGDLGGPGGLGLGAAFVSRRTWDALGHKLPALPAPGGAIRPVFFPENALNPAVPQRLGGDQWWLPAPIAGNRLDLGPAFGAYRAEGPSGPAFALWATRTPGRVRLLTNEAKTLLFASTDGSPLDVRAEKGGVSLNLPATPVLISGATSLPVPEAAVAGFQLRLAGLERLALASKRDVSDETYPIRTVAAAIKADPAGAAAALAGSVRRLERRLGDFTWLEAEFSPKHTFGEAVVDFSASGDGALALDAAIPADAPNRIDFTIPARVPGDQDVWIGARVSAENLARLSVRVNGQILLSKSPPVGAYGAGYAWYRMGTTRLVGETNDVSLQIRPRLHDPLAVDAILFAPPGFVPDGVALPPVAAPPPPKGR